MFKIVSKKNLAKDIYLMEVLAPRVALSAKPGQFVIVRAYSKGERIPLTIADYNAVKGTVTIVIQALGASTRIICTLEEGDSFLDFAGPLGQPSEFTHLRVEDIDKQRFLFIAGGVGAAPIFPQVKFLNKCGASIDVVLGARSSDLLIFSDEIAAVCDNLYISTNDGSAGYSGLVTDVFRQLVSEGKKYDYVITIGPMMMMKSVADCTKKHMIPTIASLNTLMVDGTGMCGACRVTVDGKTVFTCVDGPEFDAHKVDFDEAVRRLNMYRTEEGLKIRELEHKNHFCKIGRTA